MSKKTVVITGGRSEVARAAATSMARAGARVIMVSSSATASVARDEVVKRSGSNDIHLLVADMSLQSSVRELARQVNSNWNTIAAVVHHGVYHDFRNSERQVTAEGFERFWAQNHLGPFLLTHLLKDALIKGHGRVLTIGSTRLKVWPRMAVDYNDPNFERKSFSQKRAFFQSKVAEIQFALALKRHWGNVPVIAKSVCVPSVGADTVRRTKLPWYRRVTLTAGGREAVTPKKIGNIYAVVALSPGVAKIDDVYLDKELNAAWAPVAAFDEKQQETTWELSARSVGL